MSHRCAYCRSDIPPLPNAGMIVIPGPLATGGAKLISMGLIAEAAEADGRNVRDWLGGVPDLRHPGMTTVSPEGVAAYVAKGPASVVFMALRDSDDMSVAAAVSQVALVVARVMAGPLDPTFDQVVDRLRDLGASETVRNAVTVWRHDLS